MGLKVEINDDDNNAWVPSKTSEFLDQMLKEDL
jgi:hypothetical protein